MSQYSPKTISLYVGLANALALALLLIALKFFSPFTISWFILGFAVLAVGLGAYFISAYVMKRYLSERIRLIYRSLSDYKAVDRQKINIDTNRDVLGDVEADVYVYMQNKRREFQEQKKLEDYRREFIVNVTHELKTPIFSIEGYLETLIGGGLEDEKINMKYLKRALKNTERLSEIVKDLDTITSLQDSIIKLEFETIDLVEMIERVCESLDVLASQKNIDVVIDQANSVKQPLVEGDRHRLEQVFTNLISNSIKYGNEGGQTTITWYDIDEQYMIEVTDDGIGIPQEHIPHLFERFYRVDKNRSREAGGSGLGLSIVKHIIEAHDQTVKVRSTPGVGTTFEFTLRKTEEF